MEVAPDPRRETGCLMNTNQPGSTWGRRKGRESGLRSSTPLSPLPGTEAEVQEGALSPGPQPRRTWDLAVTSKGRRKAEAGGPDHCACAPP